MKTTIKGSFAGKDIDVVITFGDMTAIDAQQEGRNAAIFVASIYENLLIEAPSFMDKLYGLVEPIAIKLFKLKDKFEKLAEKLSK